MNQFRCPSEQPILAATLLLVMFIALLTAGATVCIVPLLVLVMMGLSYQMNQSHHAALVENALRVTPERTPGLAAIIRDCFNRLRPGQVEFFVAPDPQINAYTFGFSKPQTVVLFAPLLKVMDPDELKFIVGHELGHVALGHTWLNTLLGGMAGVPVSFGGAILVSFAFRWWNRACEYSADRAGMLACGKPVKAVTALVKLVAAGADTPVELQQALRQIDAEDDSLVNVMAESLSTHPMLIRRINEIKKYASSREYVYLLGVASRQGDAAVL